MGTHHDDVTWSTGPLLQQATVRDGSALARDPQAVQQWLAEMRPALDERLAQTGALMLRGLALREAPDFNACVPHLGDGPMRYEGGASPRAQVHGAVYESTQWPWFFRIRLHSEMSYLSTQPSRVAFFCATPPPLGGATLVCDMAEVYRRVPAAVRDRFERLGVRYIRNFSGEPGVWVRGLKRVVRDNMRQTWRFAFRTDDRREVERLCAAQGLAWSWTAGDGLRVESVLPATRPHPAHRRAGVVMSVLVHSAAIITTLIALPAATPLPVAAQVYVPIELVTVADTTNLTEIPPAEIKLEELVEAAAVETNCRPAARAAAGGRGCDLARAAEGKAQGPAQEAGAQGKPCAVEIEQRGELDDILASIDKKAQAEDRQ